MSTNKAHWHHAAALLAICWVLVVAGCGETVSSSYTDLIDAEALDQAGKTEQAIAVAREVLQSAPGNIDAKDMLWPLYLTRLNELQYKRQWKPALAVTVAALSLRPDDAEMRLERARLEGKASPLDTALQQFQRTRELGKDPYLVSEETARMLVRWRKKPARRRNYATSRRNGVQPKPKHGIPVQYSMPDSTWEKNKL